MSDEVAPASVLACTGCGARNRIRPRPSGVPVSKERLVARLAPYLPAAA